MSLAFYFLFISSWLIPILTKLPQARTMWLWWMWKVGAKTLVTEGRHCVPWGSHTHSACPNNNTYHLWTIWCSPNSLLSFLHPLPHLFSQKLCALGIGRPPSQAGLVVKNLPANAGDMRVGDLIPGSGRSPGERHGKSLQYSCLENPMEREAWRATIHRIAKSQTRLKWLSMHDLAHTHHINEGLRVREVKNLLLGPQPVL